MYTEGSPLAPSVLRAHHVEFLVVAHDTGVEGLSARLVADIEGMRGDTSETDQLEKTGMNPRAYGNDVLGTTDAQKQTFYKGVLDTLTDFQKLADDAPVRLAAGVLDGICMSCAFGAHCALPEQQAYDIAALERIKEVATEIRCTDAIAEGQKEDDPDSKWFDTDAGTVRAIVQCLRYGYAYDAEGNAFPAPADSM